MLILLSSASESCARNGDAALVTRFSRVTTTESDDLRVALDDGQGNRDVHGRLRRCPWAAASARSARIR